MRSDIQPRLAFGKSVALTYLAPEALGKILIAGGAKEVFRSRNEFLFRQSDPAVVIYYILSGTVESTVVSKQGKEGTIAQYGRGDFVGEASLSPQPVHLDSAVAKSDCALLYFGTDGMRAVLKANESVAAYFTKFLLQRTLDVQADLIDHLFNSSEKRLARILLLLANFGENGQMHPIANVTHEMLAQRVGTTRARISFFMNKFRRLGLISYNGEIHANGGLMSVVLHDSRLAQD